MKHLIKRILLASLFVTALSNTASAMPSIDGSFMWTVGACSDWAGGYEAAADDYEMYRYYFDYCMRNPGRALNPF